jgi:SAM-dependent methyltransferase
MYQRIKQLLKAILPWKLIVKYEATFRMLYYQSYRGRKYLCNCCNKKLRIFIRLKDGDLLCPYCGSISRNRRLWELLQSEFLKPGQEVLDFSPSRSLYRNLRHYSGINYTSTDYSGEFPADRHFDITGIDASDESYDLAICYHILEHIAEDGRAIGELFRVLKKNGICLIQTPFRDGDTYENPSIRTPEQRKIHFGQEDHLRVYSAKGLKDRLESAGFRVEHREYNESPENTNGFKIFETILIAAKPA